MCEVLFQDHFVSYRSRCVASTFQVECSVSKPLCQPCSGVETNKSQCLRMSGMMYATSSRVTRVVW